MFYFKEEKVYMSTSTVNIAFNSNLLKEIDREAKAEFRTRSEFLREAARVYIERKQKWNSLLALGQQISIENQLSPDDVANEIAAHRKEKSAHK